MGGSRPSLEDVKQMNLAQLRAFHNEGKRRLFMHNPSSDEDVRQAARAWDDFLIREYGAKA